MMTDLLKLLMLLGCFETIRAQCGDLRQEVEVGQYFDIVNPGDPDPYQPDIECRWIAVARTGKRLKLTCGTFNIPASTNCEQDRVSISLTGDTTLSDAHKYCGRGTFTLVSENENMVIQLYSPSYSRGGKFKCNITAIDVQPQCECGWKKQTRIVGGHETGVNEYPYMAGLVDRAKRQVYCGSVIISKSYVMTAAHCLLGKVPANITVLVGDHDISTGADTPYSRLYSVNYFISHEAYSTLTQQNDIALIRVNGPIIFSEAVGPVCLPFQYTRNSFTGQTVVVLGWGTKQFGGERSNVLLAADLGVISPNSCAAEYGTAVTTRQMCTYANGRDACQADSGGPVLWQNPATSVVFSVGVISYGIGCASAKPGVCSRVTTYGDWIVANTPGETYCNKA